jgi:hypothetical protein
MFHAAQAAKGWAEDLNDCEPHSLICCAYQVGAGRLSDPSKFLTWQQVSM